MADVQIDRSIKLRIIEFVDHIGADNAQLRSAMRHKCRNVERPDTDQADVGMVCVKTEPPVIFVAESGLWHDPGPRHQRQDFGKDAPLGNGNNERLRHDAVAHIGRMDKWPVRAQMHLSMTPLEAFGGQVAYCLKNDAPVTAAIVAALATAVDHTTATGTRVLGWAGNPVSDALPLRLTGGVHHLWRTGQVPELTPLFDGSGTPQENARGMGDILARHDRALLSWLDGPPQTNEPGRSAQLMTGLLEIVARHGPKIEIFEIGSSAGLNLLIDQFRIDLPGMSTGPLGSTVRIVPEWRGTLPPTMPPAIVGIRGVDIAPIDATTSAGTDRLLAYCWVDHTQRIERLERALALFRAHPPHLEQGDAPDWLEARLNEPQAKGVTRVLMHSIVWQYIDAKGQARIQAAMEAAGARATPDRPLGWVRVEADRTVHRHDICVQSWPGHGETVLIGHAHAHGFWVERV